MFLEIKCKKCRQIVLNTEECVDLLIDAHGKPFQQESICECPSVRNRSIVYLDEDRIPKWIEDILQSQHFRKGKIHCQHCYSRLGGFDFVRGRMCECDLFLLPSIHLNVNKIDMVRFS